MLGLYNNQSITRISQVQGQVVGVAGGVGQQGPILSLVGAGGYGRVPLYTCVETEGVGLVKY